MEFWYVDAAYCDKLKRAAVAAIKVQDGQKVVEIRKLIISVDKSSDAERFAAILACHRGARIFSDCNAVTSKKNKAIYLEKFGVYIGSRSSKRNKGNYSKFLKAAHDTARGLLKIYRKYKEIS